MKKTIDLLPKERKDLLQLERTNRFIFKSGLIVIFAIVLLILFLTSMLFIINIYNRANQEETSRVEKGEINGLIQETKREIDNYYLKTEQLVKEISQRKNYFDYLAKINELLPEEIFYSKIIIEEEKIKLEGLAKNRDDLVRFKEILSKEQFFNEVEMPISNFTSQENVNFEINLTLNKK